MTMATQFNGLLKNSFSFQTGFPYFPSLKKQSMFGLFKKKKKEEKKLELLDLYQNQLNIGDKVESLRYDLGISTLINDEDGLYYQSDTDGRKVHWTRMIDASTQFQKVKKLDSLVHTNKAEQ